MQINEEGQEVMLMNQQIDVQESHGKIYVGIKKKRERERISIFRHIFLISWVISALSELR